MERRLQMKEVFLVSLQTAYLQSVPSFKVHGLYIIVGKNESLPVFSLKGNHEMIAGHQEQPGDYRILLEEHDLKADIPCPKTPETVPGQVFDVSQGEYIPGGGVGQPFPPYQGPGVHAALALNLSRCFTPQGKQLAAGGTDVEDFFRVPGIPGNSPVPEGNIGASLFLQYPAKICRRIIAPVESDGYAAPAGLSGKGRVSVVDTFDGNNKDGYICPAGKVKPPVIRWTFTVPTNLAFGEYAHSAAL